MSKVRKLNKKVFKKTNLENWKDVSDFWISNKLSQKQDLKEFVLNKIVDVSENNIVNILDVGCGEGWILNVLKDSSLKFNYTGIDYNSTFIDYLNEKKENATYNFYTDDIENPKSEILKNKYDLIINSFSLFEMPNYKKALQNEINLLKQDGSIAILSIDPITQLLAISIDFEEFKKNISLFSQLKKGGYYRKLIDTGNGFAKQEYLGILHSMADYFKELKKYDFKMEDLDEINLLNDTVPKIYEYARFRK